MTALDKITKARVQLIIDNPFFGNIATRLELIEDDSFPTMATDGKSIRFNSDFVDRLPVAHLKGVMAHEVCHVIYQHHLRRKHRDHTEWNQACDFAINSILLDAGFSLPEDGCIDVSHKGKSAEDIHRDLFGGKISDTSSQTESSQGSDQGSTQGNDQGSAGKSAENSRSANAPDDHPVDMQGHGVVLDGTSDDGQTLTPSQLEEEEAKWTDIVLTAAMISGEAGNADSPFKQLIKQLRKPQIDWPTQLRRFLLDGQPTNRTYQRLGRRSSALGVALPSRQRDIGGEIAVLIDASSSVDDQLFAQFCDELQLIMAEHDITANVIKYTHNVRDVSVVEPGDAIDRTRYYGGTNTAKAFNHLTENDISCDAIIVFSDAEDYWDRIDEPDAPTLLCACFSNDYWRGRIEKDAGWVQTLEVTRD